MSVTAQTAALPISDALVARLESLSWLKVYKGEVPDKVPLIQVNGHDDPAHRVAPYAVVYPGAGRPDPNPNLAATAGDHLYSGQVTFVAGWQDDLLRTIDRARPLLHLWTPVITGINCGRMRQPLGVDIGNPRRADDVKPPRFWLPFLWQLHVT